jgi:predicted TIM-barrel fold metal-dependent hydrolase
VAHGRQECAVEGRDPHGAGLSPRTLPKLRVVGCHLGSDEDDLGRLAKRLDTYPNFAVDTAARIRYFARGDRDKAREFLIKYQDRILYATDFGLRAGSPEAGAKTLLAWHARDWNFFVGDAAMDYEGRPTRGLALPDAVLHKLFHDNARRWLPGIGV